MHLSSAESDRQHRWVFKFRTWTLSSLQVPKEQTCGFDRKAKNKIASIPTLRLTRTFRCHNHVAQDWTGSFDQARAAMESHRELVESVTQQRLRGSTTPKSARLGSPRSPELPVSRIAYPASQRTGTRPTSRTHFVWAISVIPGRC